MEITLLDTFMVPTVLVRPLVKLVVTQEVVLLVIQVGHVGPALAELGRYFLPLDGAIGALNLFRP